MEGLLDTLLLLGFICGCAFLVAQLSKEKDIGFWTLFVTSVFLTPFVGLLIGLIAKRRLKEGETHQVQESFLSKFTKKKDSNEENKMDTENKWKFDSYNPNNDNT